MLLAAALYISYIALSLLDPWGYFSPLVQLAVYCGVFLVIMMLLFRAMVSNNKWTIKTSSKGLVLSLLLMSISGTLADKDFNRLFEIAVKPRALFDYPVPEIMMSVIPPDYSGEEEFSERLSLNTSENSGLKPLPEGSEIILHVTNTPYAPILIAGHQIVPFLSHTDGGFAARFFLKDEVYWKIKEGSREIGSWPFLILEDEAPVIERADFRHIMTGNGLFGMTLAVSDDYGVNEIAVGILPKGNHKEQLIDRTKLPISEIKNFSGEAYINLAASDYAGGTIDLVVEATDKAGQKSRKIISGVSLPLREFSDPVSRKIIAIRDGVIKTPDIRKKLARELMALGLVPDDGKTPSIYYMGLRSAYWRLTNPKSDDDVISAREILWKLANQLEDGNRGQFDRDILEGLASLKVTLSQRKDLDFVKKSLQDIDKILVLYWRAQDPSFRNNTLVEYDVKALRKVYSKIMEHTHYKKFDQAIELVSYLEHGFIYRDKDILSGQGYDRFKTMHQSRDMINILEKTQRQIMSFVYKNTVKIELASTNSSEAVKLPPAKDVQNWIKVQQKLGETIHKMNKTLMASGVDVSQITVAVGDLTRDSAYSMETGDMGSAATYQSQILTLLSSLKKMLESKMGPELKETPAPSRH